MAGLPFQKVDEPLSHLPLPGNGGDSNGGPPIEPFFRPKPDQICEIFQAVVPGFIGDPGIKLRFCLPQLNRLSTGRNRDRDIPLKGRDEPQAAGQVLPKPQLPSPVHVDEAHPLLRQIRKGGDLFGIPLSHQNAGCPHIEAGPCHRVEEPRIVLVKLGQHILGAPEDEIGILFGLGNPAGFRPSHHLDFDTVGLGK